jgi:AraC family transcriptional regulator
MEPSFQTLAAKKLVGKRMRMSFSDNRTFELWREFMPRRAEIKNSVGAELYSVEVYDYDPLYFSNFDPAKEFDKWAAVEVTDFDAVPSEMETFMLRGGLYAVFVHKGPASAGPETYRYIFGTWLPSSAFLLADRPHFAVMGAKYRHEDPSSEEEIWIPIRPKE